MLWLLPATAQRCLVYATETILSFAFVFAVAYKIGWIHRFVWFFAQTEAKKVLNGALVTAGSIRFDLVRGRFWATNVVIHSPQQAVWRWESPVLARVGEAYVEVNLLWCLFSLFFLGEEQPVDVYTIRVSDIQGFIERKLNLFNFFLLDPRVELPDLTEALEDELDSEEEDDEGQPLNQPACPEEDLPEENTNTEEKAQQIMDDVLRAISRAVKEGSIQGALVEHRDKITSQLKALQSTTKKSEAMQEGVKIVQHVSKAVVEKTQTVQQVVHPTRRAFRAHERIVFARLGRIVITDARIFTRDHQQREKGTTAGSLSSWNKPIWIQRVDVRSSELCPPLSAKDEDDNPTLYQPIDRCLEVVWKRVLAEGAKANTSRLFQTAMGEILKYWMEKDGSSTCAPAVVSTHANDKI